MEYQGYYSTGHDKNSSLSSARAEFRSIEFTGRAKEYFGIWLSNLVLTLVTLGVYAAWAKVRRIQYFSYNTVIDGFGLVYHATGLQLFLSRVIVFGIFIAYSAATALLPVLSALSSPVIFFALPWIINRSMRFNAAMTTWRNVRFVWHGTYWKTLWFFVICPVLGIVSLGLLIPYFTKLYYQYYGNNYAFGYTRFSADSDVLSYYRAFLVSITLSAVIVLLFFCVVAGFLAAVQGVGLASETTFELAISALPALLVLVVILLWFIFRTLCRNILVNALVLIGAARFQSKVKPLRLLWIVTSNFFAIIFTLGLLIPWAAVRYYAYLAHCTEYAIDCDVDAFIDDVQKKVGSFGEEFADFEGIDISI